MKKSELITGVILTLAGAAALAAALLTETAFDGIFWGVAGAGLCLGIGMVIRFFRWSAPDRSEQYREILENKEIGVNDELNRKLKVRRMTERNRLSLMKAKAKTIITAATKMKGKRKSVST